MSRRAAELRGRSGEDRAVRWLRWRFYRILARRVRTPRGEVDIVARRGVVFIEVKARDTEAELDLAIDERRLARVAAAAQVLAPRFARATDDIRVDVILVAPGLRPRHLVNVWHG